MKKISFILAIILAFNNKLAAGDREWATVGKVLTGVAAVSIIHRIAEPQPIVVYQQPVVIQPQPVVVQTVVVQPTPVVYYYPVVVYRTYPMHHGYWVRR